MNKYTKQAQSEWLNSDSWENKPTPSLWFSLLVIAMCAFGWFLINGIADWSVGL